MNCSWINPSRLQAGNSDSGFLTFIKHLLCITFFLFSAPVWGLQAVNDMPQAMPRLLAPIEFDGKVGDGEWDAIDTISLISHWPAFSDKPNSRTLFRVAYDEKFLYFSAVCFDKPHLIQGPNFERDNWAMTMDHVAIILDTYNDNENGVIFVVTLPALALM